MPKTKLGEKYSQKDPPIDWLHAAILERLKVKRLNLRDMAKAAGCSYESMRQYATKSPWDWPRPVRESVCKELGVDIIIVPKRDGVEVTV